MRWLHRTATALALALLPSIPVAADSDGEAERVVRFRFTPTERAQFALWIERADGTFVRTVRLTEATAKRGIGNRPGALQMNSGYRWPYGRREGVLPVWAHRRASAPGHDKFPRVIFQDRASEGYASRTSDDYSPDDYFCLSFDKARSKKDALDAVSCASQFNSDKGRYLTEEDVAEGYAEPWENRGGDSAEMRTLPLRSLYPPRRDAEPCTSSSGCFDHPNVAHFDEDAREVMPHIDAVTMATPPGGEPTEVTFRVPSKWENGDYVAWLEVNTEGDYNEYYGPDNYPTPDSPDGKWDHWAKTYGYPYRGQPSVVYKLPFSLTAAGGKFEDMTIAGYSNVHGQDGMIRDMDGRITQSPDSDPGSGADRLMRSVDGPRFAIDVLATNVCEQPDPPEACGSECTRGSGDCGEGLICGPDKTCVGMCDVDMPPPAVQELVVDPHNDEKKAHRLAHLAFRVPSTSRQIGEYRVRFSKNAITSAEDFMRADQATKAKLGEGSLRLPTDVEPGGLVEADFGQLQPQTRYHVAVRAVDVCGQAGPIATSRVTTTKIHFTTVSPCFVATAAHGSPMASEVSALRRLRDRHLHASAIGRALVDAYYEVGPYAAGVIREHDSLRTVARAALSPVVELAELLD